MFYIHTGLLSITSVFYILKVIEPLGIADFNNWLKSANLLYEYFVKEDLS